MLVILVLAVLWAVVLLPEALSRRSRRGGDSISSFNRHLSSLARSNSSSFGRSRGRRPMGLSSGPSLMSPGLSRTAPRRAAASTSVGQPAYGSNARPAGQRAATPRPAAQRPTTRTTAQRRRQDVLVAMSAASLLSFLAAIAFSSVFVPVTVALVALLGAYTLAILFVSRNRPQANTAPMVSGVTYLHTRPAATAMNSGMVPAVSASSQRRSAAR